MAKGGSENQSVTLPRFYETALQQQIGMAGDASQVGYVPYYGPEVAAFTPMQNAAFENTNMAAGAFGLNQAPVSMPAPQTFAGGIQGYSSAPMYNEAVAAHQAQNPAQADYLNSFTMNPVTGAVGENAAINQPVALEMQGGSKRGK